MDPQGPLFEVLLRTGQISEKVRMSRAGLVLLLLLVLVLVLVLLLVLVLVKSEEKGVRSKE